MLDETFSLVKFALSHKDILGHIFHKVKLQICFMIYCHIEFHGYGIGHYSKVYQRIVIWSNILDRDHNSIYLYHHRFIRIVL